MKGNYEIKDLDEVVRTPNFVTDLFAKLVQLSKISNKFENNEEFAFYKKNPSIKEKLKGLNNKLFSIIEQVSLFSVGKSINLANKNLKYSDIIEILDSMLENVDSSLDKINVVAEKSTIKLPFPSEINKINRLGEDLIKPQVKYNIIDFDNDISTPFIPKIKEKTHALTPLPQIIIDAQNSGKEFLKKLSQDYEFPHPYQLELENLEYCSDQLSTQINCQNPIKFEKDNYSFIETLDGLNLVISILSANHEIAVDLEHNHERSFQGLTCLMQISTREADFLIDTLQLWNHIHLMNPVFSNPKIVKIFHGADNDIKWLQRDFGIYVINMFDTGQASRQLKKESFSFAYLLSSYCKIIANKSYQKADWRVRPLSKEMIKYAREDVHYLLFIYDKMRAELVQQACEQGLEPTQFLKSVLAKSCDICLQTYKKPKLKDESYYNLILRNKMILSTEKLKVLKNLLKWRFKYAAVEDEHPVFVLPNHIIFQLIEKTPRTVQELHSNFKKISYVAKKYINELLDILHNKSQENLPDFQSDEPKKKIKTIQERMEIEDNPPNISNNQIEIDHHKLSIQIKEQNNLPFHVQKTPILIPEYQGHFIYEVDKEKENQMNNKTSKISGSFNYEHHIQYIIEVHPHLKKLFSEECKHQIDRETCSEKVEINQKKIEQNNVKNKDFDFISFSQEKGPPPKINSKEISLNIDQKNLLNDLEKRELPKSLKEQYGITINEKKKSKKRNYQDVEPKEKSEHLLKKIKKEQNNAYNKFAILNNEDFDDEKANAKKKNNQDLDLEKISKKIIENINNPKHIKKSFDVLEKMEENYGIRSKKKEKKQKQSIFGNKNKVFSLKKI